MSTAMRQIINKKKHKRWLAVSAAAVFVMLPLVSAGEMQAAGDTSEIVLSKSKITLKNQYKK